MPQLSKEQIQQESEYQFPYHYLDFIASYGSLKFIEYLTCIEIIKELIKPYNGQLILDVGCGDGRFCYEIKKENVKIIGLDFSQKAINFAKAFNPEVKFFVQDMENINLPYPFDYVLLIETLEHTAIDRIPYILNKISGILNKDGILIIVVPTTNLKLSKKHYQHFTEKNLSSLLKQYFTVINIIGYSKISYKRIIFSSLQTLGVLISKFRYIGNPIDKLFISLHKYLNNYYRANLSIGNPDKCLRLIAVCKKL